MVVSPGETRWSRSNAERLAFAVGGGVAKEFYGCGTSRVFHGAGDIVGMRPDGAGVSHRGRGEGKNRNEEHCVGLIEKVSWRPKIITLSRCLLHSLKPQHATHLSACFKSADVHQGEYFHPGVGLFLAPKSPRCTCSTAELRDNVAKPIAFTLERIGTIRWIQICLLN